jgi:hypothetical protein
MTTPRSSRQRQVRGLATIFIVAIATIAVWAAQKPAVDYSGDGISDFPVVRNTGGGPTGAITWYIANAVSSAFLARGWGIATDEFVSGDFDGDNVADVAIWRPGTGGTGGFWIMPSQTGVGYFEPFGTTGDRPDVVGDYDGDGKTDVAVYRGGASSGNPSYWFYKRSIDGVVVMTQWGVNGDFAAPGDYDGDGRNEFAIQRNAGGGSAIFYIKQSTAGNTSLLFGAPTDVIVPGDYDGDNKTDVAIVRGGGGNIIWWIRRSSDGVVTSQAWGASNTDYPTQGDYDGDGKTDLAVWRPSATPGASAFFVSRSSGGTATRAWGQNGDYPVANFNTH